MSYDWEQALTTQDAHTENNRLVKQQQQVATD